MNVEEIIHELPKGILNWYEFVPDSTALVVETKENSTLAELLAEREVQAESISFLEFEEIQGGQYDYIIAVGVLERCDRPVEFLRHCQELLTVRGRLIIGMENRLGLRYFCGDRDPFTDRNFDGVENYWNVTTDISEKNVGRCYAKYEIEDMLRQSGWIYKRFYSVLPSLDMPQLIYAEDYLPQEKLSIRYSPMYRSPETIFMEEQHLYDDIRQAGIFHQMANAYLIECGKDELLSDIEQVTLSMDRGAEHAMATLIRKDGTVEKRALYPEGLRTVKAVVENAADLTRHGIAVVAARMEGNFCVMPYVQAEIGVAYFRRLLFQDKDLFIAEMDRYRNLILQSSEHVGMDLDGVGTGIYLKRGYVDLVPLNMFVVDGEFVFFDQEFYEENYPANAILQRTLSILYQSDAKMKAVLPREFFYERYGLNTQLQFFQKKEWEFINWLRNQRELRSFYLNCKPDPNVINSNRQRMNFSEEEYRRLFVELLDNVSGKDIYLFGAGNFARKFVARFKDEVTIKGLLDNDSSRWGQQVDGYSILSPNSLSELEADNYKVIICVKRYLPILRQLRQLGIRYIGIYDPYADLPVKKRQGQDIEKKGSEKDICHKKYGVGYIAGVFDLFHVGHLNMFRRAKEQCDYLIVGVVSDEGVRKGKHVDPFIPFEERIEMVRSCRYVDEAVEISFALSGTQDAYRKFHFDCQFSGSDYENNPDWAANKAFLEKHGAELVFFPYTEGTSSTKIKKMIDQKLL